MITVTCCQDLFDNVLPGDLIWWTQGTMWVNATPKLCILRPPALVISVKIRAGEGINCICVVNGDGKLYNLPTNISFSRLTLYVERLQE
jgi:hypothetical protein